jgi:hypothetical protein
VPFWNHGRWGIKSGYAETISQQFRKKISF